MNFLKAIGAILMGFVIIVLWFVIYALVIAIIIAVVLFFLKLFGIDVIDALGL